MSGAAGPQTAFHIRKAAHHFAAAHFTIFSASERERLHGHNYRIAAIATGRMRGDGLCFDYNILKQMMARLVARYDEYTLIAGQSPHLQITEDGDCLCVRHHHSDFRLPRDDCRLLPVANITIENLAHHLLDELRALIDAGGGLGLHRLEMQVSHNAEQWASAVWDAGGDGGHE